MPCFTICFQNTIAAIAFRQIVSVDIVDPLCLLTPAGCCSDQCRTTASIWPRHTTVDRTTKRALIRRRYRDARVYTFKHLRDECRVNGFTTPNKAATSPPMLPPAEYAWYSHRRCVAVRKCAKPEVHSVPQRRQTRTEPHLQTTRRGNFVKLRLWFLKKFLEYARGQKDLNM